VAQGVQPFGALEVERVVDGRLSAQRAVLFEALLDMRVLELDVQARRDADGDDSRLLARIRRRRVAPEPGREQQADAVWSAQVEVVPDDYFKELTARRTQGAAEPGERL
jgi:hypothetical protein